MRFESELEKRLRILHEAKKPAAKKDAKAKKSERPSRAPSRSSSQEPPIEAARRVSEVSAEMQQAIQQELFQMVAAAREEAEQETTAHAQGAARKEEQRGNSLFRDVLSYPKFKESFLEASSLLDDVVPDLVAAQRPLAVVYNAMLPFLESRVRSAAYKYNIGVGRKKLFKGSVDFSSGPVSRFDHATISGPLISDAYLSAYQAKVMASIEAYNKEHERLTPGSEMDQEAAKYFRNPKDTKAEVDRIAAERNRVNAIADDDFMALVDAGSDRLTSVPRSPMTYATLKSIMVNFDARRAEALKDSEAARLFNQMYGASPRQLREHPTIRSYREYHRLLHPAVVAITKKFEVANLNHTMAKKFQNLPAGVDGILTPSEIVNEFFGYMGLRKVNGRSVPLQGFYHLLVKWGRALNPESFEFDRTATYEDMLKAFGSAISIVAKNVARNQGLGQINKLSFVTLPDSEDGFAMKSREGVGNSLYEGVVKAASGFIHEKKKDAESIRSDLYDASGFSFKQKRLEAAIKAKSTTPEAVDAIKDALKNGGVVSQNSMALYAEALNIAKVAEGLFGPVTGPLARVFIGPKSEAGNKAGRNAVVQITHTGEADSRRSSVDYDISLPSSKKFFQTTGVKLYEASGVMVSGVGVIGVLKEMDEAKASKLLSKIVKEIWPDFKDSVLQSKPFRKDARKAFKNDLSGYDIRFSTPGYEVEKTAGRDDRKRIAQVRSLLYKQNVPDRVDYVGYVDNDKAAFDLVKQNWPDDKITDADIEKALDVATKMFSRNVVGTVDVVKKGVSSGSAFQRRLAKTLGLDKDTVEKRTIRKPEIDVSDLQSLSDDEFDDDLDTLARNDVERLALKLGRLGIVGRDPDGRLMVESCRLRASLVEWSRSPAVVARFRALFQ